MDEILVDALGDPIVIGNRYGYSTSANGIARTVIGEALNFTKGGRVTLKVESLKTFLYGKLIPNGISERAEKISMHSHMIFPVS